jgi:hypothetical protein
LRIYSSVNGASCREVDLEVREVREVEKREGEEGGSKRKGNQRKVPNCPTKKQQFMKTN